MINKTINVTQTFLPPIEEYQALLAKIWDAKWLTNNGPLLQQLETSIRLNLQSNDFMFCTNGTVVLQMALKAYDITGEVITTPFSYVATLNSILWENAKPIFVDINSMDFNIDVEKIEEKINSRTQAILATHVFGNPCDVLKIEQIAQKHNLKVIYDAAHAYGVEYNGKSLFNYGHISTCSFHATKIFHTGEGGGIFCNDENVLQKLKLYRQFGHINDDYYSIGINAKNSELHAAMGLAVLPYFNAIKNKRKELGDVYDDLLNLGQLKKPITRQGTKYNYSYYPVVFESENILLQVKNALNAIHVFPRRYFFPSLNNMPFLEDSTPCPVSESIASRIMCLPSSHYLTIQEQELISQTINKII